MIGRSSLLDSCNTFEDNMIETIKTLKSQCSKHEDFKKVILLGPTGSGKSTLSLLLANQKVPIIKGKGNEPLLKEETIGHGFKSTTRIPNFHIDQDNELIIIDSPGFKDSEGIEQELINSFAIDFLLSNSKNKNKIKILLVVSIYELKAYRQHDFTSILEQLYKMFPKIQKIKQSIGIVITKGEQYYSGIDLLNQIDDNIDIQVKLIIDYFKRNENQVFSLPKAIPPNINKNYEFEDHVKLMHYLINEDDYAINPVHSVAISKESEYELENLIERHIKRVDEIILDFNQQLSDQYNQASDIKDIEPWKMILKKLSREEIKNTNDLQKAVLKFIPKSEIYEKSIIQLKNTESFDSFLDKIKPHNNMSSYYEKKFRLLFNKSIDELDKNLKFARESEKRKIENEKCQNKIAHLESTISNDKIALSAMEKVQNQQYDIINNMKSKIEDNKKVQNQQNDLINSMKSKIEDSKKVQNQLSEQITQLNNKKNLEIQKLIQNNNNLVNKNNQQSSQIKDLLKTIEEEKSKKEEQNKKNSQTSLWRFNGNFNTNYSRLGKWGYKNNSKVSWYWPSKSPWCPYNNWNSSWNSNRNPKSSFFKKDTK